MNKIKSPEQYKEIIGTAKANGYKLTNCFFMPAAIRQKTADGTLFYENTDGGLLLLDDIVDFYRCYYYLSESVEPKPVHLDKQAVIEFPFTGELNEKQLAQIEKIEAMGFHLGRESGMMTCQGDKIIKRTIQQSDFTVETASENDAQKVFDLITGTFNPLYSFLPKLSELHDIIAEGRVLAIHCGSDLAAALISSVEKKSAIINQVAVDPVYRGKGLGKLIVQAYHDKYMAEIPTFQHWVDLNNTPAVNMYKSFGYEFSLRKANEYIL